MRSLYGHLADLSHLELLDGAMPSTLDTVSLDSGVFGIPYSLEGVGLIANRSMFSTADLALDSIEDFNDLWDIFRDMRDVILSGELLEDFPNLQVVTEFPAQSNVYLGRQIADVVLTEAFASREDAAESLTVEFSAEAGAQSYLRLLASYTDNRLNWYRLANISQHRQIEDGIAVGRVAMIHQNADIFRLINEIDSTLADDLILLPIPLSDIDPPAIYTGVPAFWAVNDSSSPEAQEAAKSFLTWLYTSDTGSKIVAEELLALSVFRESAHPTENPMHRQILSYTNLGQTRPWLHAEIPSGWVSLSFGPALRDWLRDEKAWDEIIEEFSFVWASTAYESLR